MPAHRYILHTNGREQRVPSVSTLLSQLGWGKDGLLYWANQLGLDGLTLEDGRRTACDIGTVVHAMIEADIRGHSELSLKALPDDVVVPAKRAFEAYVDWKTRYRFKPITTELSLVSDEYRYGGTLDLAMFDDELAVLDWKTANGLYANNVVQLCGYGYLLKHGRRCCCRSCQHHEPWIPPDGEVKSYHLLRLSKEDGSLHHHRWPRDSRAILAGWKTILHARELYDFEKVLKGSL